MKQETKTENTDVTEPDLNTADVAADKPAEEDSANAKTSKEASMTAKTAVDPGKSTEATEEAATPGPANARKHTRRVLWLLLGALIVIVAAVLAWYFLVRKSAPTADSSQTTSTTKKTQQKSTPVDPALAKLITPATGETWLAAPEKVDNLGYVKISDSDTQYIAYYKVGTHGQNIIYLSRDTDGPGEIDTLFEKAPDGTVRAILQPSSTQTYSSDYISNARGAYTAGVITDTTTHYDSLSFPSSLSIGNSETVSTDDKFGYPEIGKQIYTNPDTSVTRSTLHTYGSIKLVKIERKYADTHLTAISYALGLPFGNEYDLTYMPAGLDLSKYTWNNQTNIMATKDSVDSTMSGIVRGCGAIGTSVSRADAVSDGDFVAAGKTADGKTVYAFKDSNNALVQKAYQEYKDFNTGVDGYTIVSLDDFLKQHALVAYKSANNGWLVYTRDNLAAYGGCAKPVVYLYPVHTEQVLVRLGANVTKSDPQYTNGWDVTAEPNGQLGLHGKTYGSLFWEGVGAGMYPGITTGTVVKRADAAATIAKQLRQQGLNAKESADFMAYWADKIPNEPYVRLTWFNTAQMNSLAPLYVSPRPDTVVRVFLDMEGFSAPPKLPVQHLSSTPRKGFTVVEWGGLSQTVLR